MKKFVFGVIMLFSFFTGFCVTCSNEVQAQTTSADLICEAIEHGDTQSVVAEISRLVTLGADLATEINRKKTGGYPIDYPLLCAIRADNQEMVELLLANGASLDQRYCGDKETALMLSIKWGKTGMAKLLIDKGADITIPQGSWQSTPLHYAAHYGNDSILRYLIERKADINATTSNEKTPLYYAINDGHVDCVRSLIDNHADTQSNSYLTSPLSMAVENGHKGVVQLLLLEKGVNTQYINPCLMHAIGSKKKEIVEFLLHQGADVNYSSEENGDTPLIHAFTRGEVDIAKLLLDNGANINAADYKNATLLKIALLTEELCQPEKIRFLLDYGADIHAVTQIENVLATIKNQEVSSMLHSLLNIPQKFVKEERNPTTDGEESEVVRKSLLKLSDIKNGENVSNVHVVDKHGLAESIRPSEVHITYLPVMWSAIPFGVDFVTSYPERYNVGDKIHLNYTNRSCLGCNVSDYGLNYQENTEKKKFTISAKKGLSVMGYTMTEKELNEMFLKSCC